MALDYVLVTPAFNEAEYIEQTLESVTRQTRPPLKWVIVSDGSTDGTEDLVRRYLPEYDWIELVVLPPRAERDFAGKVKAFDKGLAKAHGLPYDVLGCLDADVSFAEDYFEYLLGEMAANPRIGVAGTHYTEGSFHSFRDSYINADHVNGGIQLFRSACFADIGGYRPIRGGGIDWVAVTTARMKGWFTASFGERTFEHHRAIGTGNGGGAIRSRFHYGKKDYFLGGHPLWQLSRGTFQLVRKPYVVGGAALMLGYVWCWLRGSKRPVSDDLVAFHRHEQLVRLRGLLLSGARLGR